jgi:hypothetical protein
LFVAIRVQGAGWRVLGVVCRVLVTGCRVWGVGKEEVVRRDRSTQQESATGERNRRAEAHDS